MSALRLVLLLVASAAVSAQSPPSKTIEPGDIDKSADPCRDFFDYANGAWRAQNPIPAYMARWSRRWQAGEANKEHVRDILDEVSAKRRTGRKGSVEQLIGDFYGACMDEARADELGSDAGRSRCSREIAAIKTAADVQRMIAHAARDRHRRALRRASQVRRPHSRRRRIAPCLRRRPRACRTATTTSRPSRASSKRARSTSSTSRRCSSSPARATARAQGRPPTTVFAIETRLASASLDNVALRDPQATDHKIDASPQLQKLTPDFDWTAYFDAPSMPRGDAQRDQPKFLQRGRPRSSPRRRSPTGRPTSTWHAAATRPRRLAVAAVRRGELRLQRQRTSPAPRR